MRTISLPWGLRVQGACLKKSVSKFSCCFLISLFKKGAYLINTARGELIETEALVGALQDGTIAGAGLDVLEGENEFKKGDTIPMLKMSNVVMTPHIAFNTREAETRILQTTTDNIKGFLSGSPINLVN